MEKTAIKWHEVINNTPSGDLPFLDLYREYARALHEKAEAKRRENFWPSKV